MIFVPFDPQVTVDATSTIGSGGGADWWGRAAIKRRPSDGALILAYYRSTAHATNDGFVHMRFSDDDGATWTAEDTTLLGATIPDFDPPGAGANEDAGEPWLYVCPNGDLLIHTWRVDYGSSNNGTYQWRSTDDGETWSSEGQVAFAGIANDQHIFATDDDFVLDGVIYAGARVYASAALADCYVILIKSTDNGATWEWVSNITAPGSDTQEVGLEYVGHNRIVGMVRSLNNDETFQADSSNLGATWTLTDVSSTVQVSGRHRIYTRAHLAGEAEWWTDNVLLMVGFQLMSPGSSQDRRSCIWVSNNWGGDWSGPFYIDSESEDGGYGDMFYDSANDQYVVVSYQGTLAAAALKQYRLSVTF